MMKKKKKKQDGSKLKYLHGTSAHQNRRYDAMIPDTAVHIRYNPPGKAQHGQNRKQKTPGMISHFKCHTTLILCITWGAGTPTGPASVRLECFPLLHCCGTRDILIVHLVVICHFPAELMYYVHTQTVFGYRVTFSNNGPQALNCVQTVLADPMF